MCDKGVAYNPMMLGCISDKFKTQEMCDKAVEEDPWLLKYVLDNFKKQKNV